MVRNRNWWLQTELRIMTAWMKASQLFMSTVWVLGVTIKLAIIL